MIDNNVSYRRPLGNAFCAGRLELQYLHANNERNELQ